MKVLWFSPTSGLYSNNTTSGGWIVSLQIAVMKSCPEIELGFAFESTSTDVKEISNNVAYYTIQRNHNLCDRLSRFLYKGLYDWDMIKNRCLEIVEDFKPDIIQCFGTEWPYGLIQKETKIPVVIHMQGFLQIYDLSSRQVRNTNRLNLSKLFPRVWIREYKSKKRRLMELEIMKSCRFFMGRTDWDKNLVEYFSDKAKYYHCDEVLRPKIYDSKKIWQYHQDNKFRIVTITNGSILKGNDIILQTAKILQRFGVDFEWRVAGNKNAILTLEKCYKVKHHDICIDLLGTISEREIIDELCSSHVYVHPAIIDNSPNSLCEAQLLGCPVIASYVGGIPSLIKGNDTGFFFPYNEPYSLAFQIMKLNNNQTLLESISKKEREIAYNRHSPKDVSLKLLKIYKDVINLR